jgi:CheY-like chemotaxis protein
MWKPQVAESHLKPVQKTIFLVEDNLVVSKILQRTIEAYTSHRVLHLPDGATILEKINEHKPDLLILDYELPGKNGIELYDIVHATRGCEHIPAIIMSAELPQKLVAKRNLTSLPKPYKISTLLQMLEKLL